MSDTTVTPVAASAPVEGTKEPVNTGLPPAVTPEAIETPKEAAKEDPVSSKFAALSRKEKALKAEQRRVALQQKEIQEKLKALEAGKEVDAAKYLSIDDFKKNPYKFVKEHGITLEQLAEIALNDGKPTAEKLVRETETKLQKEIRELREAMAAKEQSEAEARVQQVLEGFKQDLNKYVEATPEYEMIRANDAQELVYEVIETYFDQKVAEYTEEYGEEPDAETRNGFIMDNKRACDLVEAHLLKEEKARIEKLRNLSKIKGMFEPPAKPVESKVKENATATLTNTLSTQVPNSAAKTLTDEESKKEAAKLIKWT